MIADIATLVEDMIRDDAARVAPDQLARAVSLALVQYGRDRPRALVQDVAVPADGLISYPAGAASVQAVEYPVGQRPPAYLPPDATSRYNTPTGLKIMITAPIAANSAVRITFGARHVLSEAEDTVPEEDREALASYAAAVLFDQMSAATSTDGNPTIPADTVDHKAKPDNFAKRAERLRGRYHDLLGIDPKRLKAASVTVEQPLPMSTGGPRLTHRRGRLR